MFSSRQEMIIELDSGRIRGQAILLWLSVFHCHIKWWSLRTFASLLLDLQGHLLGRVAIPGIYAISGISKREMDQISDLISLLDSVNGCDDVDDIRVWKLESSKMFSSRSIFREFTMDDVTNLFHSYSFIQKSFSPMKVKGPVWKAHFWPFWPFLFGIAKMILTIPNGRNR